MGHGPSGSRPVLDLFVEQWPLLIFVPAVLILVAVLAGVTRWWDRRDAERSAETTARRADAATGHEVAARSPRTAGSRSRRRWSAANSLHLFLAHRPNGDGRAGRPGNLCKRPRTVNATSWHSPWCAERPCSASRLHDPWRSGARGDR